MFGEHKSHVGNIEVMMEELNSSFFGTCIGRLMMNCGRKNRIIGIDSGMLNRIWELMLGNRREK